MRAAGIDYDACMNERLCDPNDLSILWAEDGSEHKDAIVSKYSDETSDLIREVLESGSPEEKERVRLFAVARKRAGIIHRGDE